MFTCYCRRAAELQRIHTEDDGGGGLRWSDVVLVFWTRSVQRSERLSARRFTAADLTRFILRAGHQTNALNDAK